MCCLDGGTLSELCSCPQEQCRAPQRSSLSSPFPPWANGACLFGQPVLFTSLCPTPDLPLCLALQFSIMADPNLRPWALGLSLAFCSAIIRLLQAAGSSPIHRHTLSSLWLFYSLSEPAWLLWCMLYPRSLGLQARGFMQLCSDLFCVLKSQCRICFKEGSDQVSKSLIRSNECRTRFLLILAKRQCSTQTSSSQILECMTLVEEA